MIKEAVEFALVLRVLPAELEIIDDVSVSTEKGSSPVGCTDGPSIWRVMPRETATSYWLLPLLEPSIGVAVVLTKRG